MRKIQSVLFFLCICLTIKAQYPSYQWAGSISNSNRQLCAEDLSGNVYVTGNFSGTYDFDIGAGTFTLNSVGISGFLAKYTSVGNLIWAKAIITHTNTSVNEVVPMQMKVDNTGNPVIVGLLKSPGYDFDPGVPVVSPPCPYSSNSSPNSFVAKYNSNGNLLWVQSIYESSQGLNVQATDVIIDNSNNKVRVGVATSANAFGSTMKYASTPVGCQFNLPASFTSMGFGFILSYDLTSGAGIIPGNESVGFGAYTSEPDLDIDNSGNYYYGYTSTSTNSTSINLGKKNSSGITQWNSTIGTTGSIANTRDIALDASNNIYVLGTYSNTVDFDPSASTTTLSTLGSYDVFLAQYSNTGSYLWCGGFGNAGFNNSMSTTIDKQTGDIYLLADISNSGGVDLDFGPGVSTFTTTLSSEHVFIRYNSSKSFIWASKLSNIYPHEVYASDPGNIYLTGKSPSTFDYNFSPSTNTLVPGAFVAKYVGCSSAPSTPGVINGIASICSGTNNLTYSITPVSGASSYSWILPGGWSGSSVTNTISTTTSLSGGIISVSANNACGSSSTSVLSVTINPTPTITVNSGSICTGNSFTISPSGAGTYTIQGGSAIVSPTATASYTVVGTSTAGCVSASSATSNVTVNASPAISVNSGSICSGNSFTISPSGANTYTIQAGNAVVSPTATTSYTVVGTSTAGCVSSSPATSNVTVNPLPTIGASTSNSMLCVGQSATLTASGASTYTFNPGGTGTSIVVSPSITSTYTISGTSAQGCNNSSVFTQSVSTCAGIEQIITQSYSSVVFPNPSNGKYTIKSINLIQNIEVLNLLGEIVLSKVSDSEIAEIDITEQVNGVYILKIDNKIQLIIKQ